MLQGKKIHAQTIDCQHSAFAALKDKAWKKLPQSDV
jgi:hypothetical protein